MMFSAPSAGRKMQLGKDLAVKVCIMLLNATDELLAVNLVHLQETISPTCVESGAPRHFESDGLYGVDHELAAAHDGLLDVLLPQREGVRGRRLHLEGRHPRRRDVVLALVLGLLVKQHLPARWERDAIQE